MKRKIISILFALVLVLSFSLVTAVPVEAAPGELNVVPFTLEYGEAATATWVTAEKYAGASSVELVNVDGTVDYAEVYFGVDIALEHIDLDTTSFWCYSTEGTHIPYFMFDILGEFGGTGVRLRINNDAADSAGYTADWAEFVASSTTSEWQWQILDADWNVVDEGWATWDSLVTTYGTEIVNAVLLELSGIAGAFTAYVDAVTVNGTTYDLEGTAEDYTTITAAIGAAGEGDTISVAAGIYNAATGESFPITVNTANLTIQAASSAIIDGGSMLGPGVEITAEDVKFQGFTIRDFTCTPSAGMGAIWVKAGGAVIDNNIIYDITTQLDPINDPAGIGIAVWTQSGAHTDIQITNNVIHDVGSIGIRVRDNYEQAEKLTAVQNVLIEGNEVYKCGNSNVLIAGFVEGVTVRDNEIYDSSLPNRYGIRLCIYPIDITIEDNDIHDNYRNVVIAGADNITIADNTIEDSASGSTNVYITNNYNLDNELAWLIGTLTLETLSTNIEISSNNITDAGYGVKIENFGASDPSLMATTTTINFNNISGNTVYGVENTITTDVDAENNWWGNASGPQPDGAVYTSYGDAVSTLVTCNPWLLEVVDIEEVASGILPETYDKTLALKDKWTLVSTDKEVTANTTWVGTTALSDSATILPIKYTPADGYTQVILATQLTPVDAFYVKTDGGGGVGIDYSTDAPGVVTKPLGAGWNIISCAGETDAYTLLSQLRYALIGQEEGVGLTNLIGQGGYNQFTGDISKTLVTDNEWLAITPAYTQVTLNAFDGYWVQMNADKSFGVIP